MDLKTINADLVVNIDCKISYRAPPRNTEEQIIREASDRALAKIAHDLQESVGHMVLAVVKIKSEGDLCGR
jgi:hypothetical protein